MKQKCIPLDRILYSVSIEEGKVPEEGSGSGWGKERVLIHWEAGAGGVGAARQEWGTETSGVKVGGETAKVVGAGMSGIADGERDRQPVAGIAAARVISVRHDDGGEHGSRGDVTGLAWDGKSAARAEVGGRIGEEMAAGAEWAGVAKQWAVAAEEEGAGDSEVARQAGVAKVVTLLRAACGGNCGPVTAGWAAQVLERGPGGQNAGARWRERGGRRVREREKRG
ncbi:hypothetical protein C8F04DRAFT_1355561 [Mycena alexandri]|uniref:Uncharacterized protein n=1 Tax=Mycena alexandri TaxID=1745969 RepID=A0AAD6SUP6_9AGAR|nr:hypothetical protein C8F04DRAFT_1355561 [Mycena alexandri]